MLKVANKVESKYSLSDCGILRLIPFPPLRDAPRRRAPLFRVPLLQVLLLQALLLQALWLQALWLQVLWLQVLWLRALWLRASWLSMPRLKMPWLRAPLWSLPLWPFLLWSALWPILGSAKARAVIYEAPINDSGWVVNASVFECRISHNVPYYGEAVFSRRAGEAQRFFLRSKTSRLKTGKALLMSRNPVWKPNGERADFSLGYIAVHQGLRPLSVDAALSQTMLTELHQGRRLVFTRRPWYGADESVNVALSSISFRPAYRDYLECLASLLPVNFDQIARTSIHFPTGGDELRPGEARKLDNIAIYVEADPSVTGYVIDGHTDSVGKRADNLELSKRRAEVVTQYLIGKGVDADKITTRWHGERYPVTSNRNPPGRAQNRRVTIRLDRAGDTKREARVDREEPVTSSGG